MCVRTLCRRVNGREGGRTGSTWKEKEESLTRSKRGQVWTCGVEVRRPRGRSSSPTSKKGSRSSQRGTRTKTRTTYETTTVTEVSESDGRSRLDRGKCKLMSLEKENKDHGSLTSTDSHSGPLWYGFLRHSPTPSPPRHPGVPWVLCS